MMEEGLSRGGFTLVLGGVRSGKSAFARRLSEGTPCGGRRVYLATAGAGDEEMRRRIERHRKERGPGWTTVEEPVELAGAVAAFETGDVVLVDCLTLYLSNLMGLGRGDDDILRRVDALGRAMAESRAALTVVSNEVGGGITPVNATARRFADLSGLMNQRMAGAAGRVFLITAGIPARLK